jgi:hypothetical protein
MIELRRHRTINPGKVFDLHLPLEQVAEGYRAMDERRSIKMLLDPYKSHASQEWHVSPELRRNSGGAAAPGASAGDTAATPPGIVTPGGAFVGPD